MGLTLRVSVRVRERERERERERGREGIGFRAEAGNLEALQRDLDQTGSRAV